jgi:hypothetical protein
MIIIVLLLVFSCTQEDIPGVDSAEWKDDKGGCNGYRNSVVALLSEQKDELERKNVKQLRGILGNPDRHELEKRNSRRFVYYTSEGNHCNNGEPSDTTPNITVRIDPLGEVIEITFYNQAF